MQLEGYKVLSQSEIAQIHESSLYLLERTGSKVLSNQALDVFSEGGATVDLDNQIVRFPRSLVEDAIASVPSSFSIFHRDEERSLDIGGNNLYFVAGMDANYVWEPSNSIRRSGTKQDVADFARLADALPNIQLVSPQVIAHDVPGRAALVHAFEAVVNNTSKPIYVTPGDGISSRAIFDMAQVIAGDVPLSQRSFVIGYAAPTSPLTWQTDAVEATFEVITRGIPCALGPAPLMGMTGPITPAGSIALSNAEILSGIVLAYLIRKGTPMLYGIMPITVDMRLGLPAHGDANTALARLAGAQMARHYDIPGIVSGPNSDSHALDEQNSWEKMLTSAVSTNAGINLMVNSGSFATVSTASYEQLILDNEMAGIWLQMQKGFEVSEETLAIELIESVGIGGNYLAQMHTMTHWSQDYSIPELSNRKPFTTWQSEGQKNIVTVAAERAKQVLREHQAIPLSSDSQQELARLCKVFENQVTQ
jgi:trimethylamine---corrinoid protein Co-methyltransferase